MSSKLCANLTLKSYQCGPAAWLEKHPKQKGLACLYSTGFGKTLTAVSVAATLLKAGTINRVVAITPKSVMGNMKDAFLKCGGRDALAALGKLKVKNFEAVRKDPTCIGEVTSRTLLIIDEAHRLRDPGTGLHKVATDLCRAAGKVLLLTATPMVNDPHDLVELMRLLRPNFPAVETGAGFQREAKHLVAFPDIDLSDEFPALVKEKVEVVLSPEQMAKLVEYERKAARTADAAAADNGHAPPAAGKKANNAYLNQTRQLCLGIPPTPSPKLLKMVEMMRRVPGKALVFVTFVKSGLHYVMEYLHSVMPTKRLGKITGDTSATERARLVEAYNQDKLDILLISSAGQEGLDFKGTRSIHHLNAGWNPAETDQRDGRGRRFRSHHHLPPAQRVVHSFQYISRPPDKECLAHHHGAACTEMHLYQLEQQKRKKIQKIMTALLNASIPHLCDDAGTGPIVPRGAMCSAANLPVGFPFRGFNGIDYVVILTKGGKKRWARAKRPPVATKTKRLAAPRSKRPPDDEEDHVPLSVLMQRGVTKTHRLAAPRSKRPPDDEEDHVPLSVLMQRGVAKTKDRRLRS
jgi:hypothetical protein